MQNKITSKTIQRLVNLIHAYKITSKTIKRLVKSIHAYKKTSKAMLLLVNLNTDYMLLIWYICKLLDRALTFRKTMTIPNY